MNRIEIIKWHSFCYKDFTRNRIMSYFYQRKILETPFSERRFHLLYKFLHFVDNESYDEATFGSKDSINSNPYWIF
jgi:hypothetical protein